MFLNDNITTLQGHLYFAGQDTVQLAKTYGTPLYLMDEDRIRQNIRTYQNALKNAFGERAGILYAGKACAFKQMYRILQEENTGIDVVSSGEILTAFQAGFDMSKAYFHGNNKTDEDIAFAMDKGVGVFVLDNEEELLQVSAEASGRGIVQQVLLRVTPGIDTHTYEAVNTGKVDSKFGNAIVTGSALKMTEMILAKPSLKLLGFHCHVGSQVFTEDVFERAAEIMLEFMADVREKLGFTGDILDLGGGYGVRYTGQDPELVIEDKIAEVASRVHETCRRLQFPTPFVYLEPGRSIVADAGMTLYTAGAVKKIPGYKTYVSVDGGMTDNPRYALYRSAYTCFNASRMYEEKLVTADLVGRCCESGDILQPRVLIPQNTEKGDIIAVCITGAYNYSMSSNYNRIPRPPVVMLKDGKSYIAVRRETIEDVTSLDV